MLDSILTTKNTPCYKRIAFYTPQKILGKKNPAKLK